MDLGWHRTGIAGCVAGEASASHRLASTAAVLTPRTAQMPLLRSSATCLGVAALALANAAPYSGPGALPSDRASVVYRGGSSGKLSAGPTPGTNGVSVSPVIKKVIDGNATDGIAGYTTWNLSVVLTGNAKSAYTIYGSHDGAFFFARFFRPACSLSFPFCTSALFADCC